MALVLKDRVKETTATTGTGSYVLDGAATGFQSFTDALADGDTTYYAVENGTDWETGLGTWTESTTTLARTTVYESSNSGNAVDWAAGSKDIFITQPATRVGNLPVYATSSNLPSVSQSGDLAFVSGNDRLYLFNGSGWYNIALVNQTPTISGNSASYTLATDGTATTVTLTGTDPEGLPITWSATTSGTTSAATVTNSDNVFTITPSTDSANEGTITVTFKASDGINIGTASSEFSLSFSIDWSSIAFEAKILPDSGAGSELWGQRVRVSGDYLVVCGNATQEVQVWSRSGSTWSHMQTITSSNLGTYNDSFGNSFDIDGDTLAIGAHGARSLGGTTNDGACYIYRLSSGTWSLEQTLTPSDLSAGDSFGSGVFLDGDNIIVGSYLADYSATVTNTGRSYIFTRSGTTWTQQASLVPTWSRVNSDHAGYYNALSGDTAVVSGYLADYDGSIANSGKVEVFTRSGTTWTSQQVFDPPSADAVVNMRYGNAVAVLGDRLVVTASGHHGSGTTDTGKLYIYDRSGSTWSLTTTFEPNVTTDYNYGFTVGLDEDVIVVSYHVSSEAIFLITRDPDTDTWSQTTLSLPSGYVSGSQLGAEVDIDGNTVVAGAPRDDHSSLTDVGAVYVYTA